MVDLTGKSVEIPQTAMPEDLDTIERLRDVIIVKLAKRRVTRRAIGAVIGLHHSNVTRRLHAIPERVRRYYESIEVSLG